MQDRAAGKGRAGKASCGGACKRDPRKPANESGHSSYGAADINCDAVGIG